MKQRAVKPIDRTNLAARVYMEIRESLIAGRFLPGERLRISEMAHAFGTSDTPVREALLRLVSEHALEMYAAKLIEVPPLSMARYIEIRTVRIALERLAVELAAPNVGKKELQELIKINSRFAEAESNRVAGAQMEHNRQFHFAIYSRCGLPRLLAMIENMWTSMGPVLAAYYRGSKSGYDSGHGHHDAMLKALKAGDGARAAAALEDDILSAAPSIEQFLREHEERASTQVLAAA